MENRNLFAALRAAFPQDLDSVAVENDSGLAYSWRDLERRWGMNRRTIRRYGIAAYLRRFGNCGYPRFTRASVEQAERVFIFNVV